MQGNFISQDNKLFYTSLKELVNYNYLRNVWY